MCCSATVLQKSGGWFIEVESFFPAHSSPGGCPHPTFQDHNFISNYLNILRIAGNTFAGWKIKTMVYPEIFIGQETGQRHILH